MTSLLVKADKVRAMLEHQEKRLDERVKTLLTLQAVLFAALSFSWDKIPGLPIIFCIVGILASSALSIEASHSQASVREIVWWWKKNRGNYSGPPVIEPQSRGGALLKSGSRLFSLAIGVAWGGILGLTIFYKLLPR